MYSVMFYIFSDAAKQNDSWDTRGKPDTSREIPLLMQNKVPEGFETDDRLDVSLRPDEVKILFKYKCT